MFEQQEGGYDYDTEKLDRQEIPATSKYIPARESHKKALEELDVEASSYTKTYDEMFGVGKGYVNEEYHIADYVLDAANWQNAQEAAKSRKKSSRKCTNVCISWSMSDWITSPWTVKPTPCRAARPSASGWPARLAPAWWE